MTERILVIGADAAGMSAAWQAKGIAGDAVEIVAFERGRQGSYSACVLGSHVSPGGPPGGGAGQPGPFDQHLLGGGDHG